MNIIITIQLVWPIYRKYALKIPFRHEIVGLAVSGNCMFNNHMINNCPKCVKCKSLMINNEVSFRISLFLVNEYWCMSI